MERLTLALLTPPRILTSIKVVGVGHGMYICMVIWPNLDDMGCRAVSLARVSPLEACGPLDAGHANAASSKLVQLR